MLHIHKHTYTHTHLLALTLSALLIWLQIDHLQRGVKSLIVLVMMHIDPDRENNKQVIQLCRTVFLFSVHTQPVGPRTHTHTHTHSLSRSFRKLKSPSQELNNTHSGNSAQDNNKRDKLGRPEAGNSFKKPERCHRVGNPGGMHGDKSAQVI